MKILKLLFKYFRIIGNLYISYREYLAGIILLLIWIFSFIIDLIHSHDLIYALKNSWILLLSSSFFFLFGYLMNRVFFIDFSKNKRDDK